MAGGGDGTISAAAAALKDTDKALAVLPAGTMNLFARGLGIPQRLEDALAAFAAGEIKAVDLASADGKPFVHQFSIGLHAKMVVLREKMEFASRLGKIGASVRAAYRTVMKPPSMRVQLTIGGAEIVTRISGIGISNNLFGEGHLPYADRPDGGVLGIYVTVAKERGELLRLAANLARGRWKDNDQVEIHEAEEAELKLLSGSRKFRCVIDGELHPLKEITRIRIHKKALKVLVPSAEKKAAAAGDFAGG
ncbi:diacylglycerol kinase family protein [Mesorhizobium sp. LHD-90]|uniref:diacylglycerol/lipid kinase family protein n=1 Tax=Mesorhizobium sp. LHD-90 TaxID=3071414 RepID=UPI0027E1DF51|nr:diacylglycerol kinase family protein [Mesorhizobium sp. LHD-90]MDQ6433597.1 diacylglycerol kinase family protein [Mesorhizobium sp. LHD-90]